jgi:hypothetical protein
MIPPGVPRLLAKESFFTCCGLGSSRFELPAAGTPEALSGEFDPMRIVHEAVENGVGVGGVANDLVPSCERELGSDDRRSAAVTLFEDVEQIVTGAGVEGFEAEIAEKSPRMSRSGRPRDLMSRRWRPAPRASAWSSQSFGQRWKRGAVVAALSHCRVTATRVYALGLLKLSRRPRATWSSARRAARGVFELT